MRKILLLVAMLLALALPAAASAGVTQPTTYDGQHAFHQGVYINSWILKYCYPGGCNYTDVGHFTRDMAKMQQIGFHDAIVPAANNPSLAITKMLDTAQSYGRFLVLSLPYTTPQADALALINATKGHPAQYGYYIADEPGQHSGEDLATEKAKVTNFANFIRANDTNPSHRIFTAHFGCDRNLVNVFQKPFAQTAVIDQAMVDCYPILPGNDAPDGNGIDQIVFAAWDQMTYNSINAQRQSPRAIGQLFSWHQDDLSKPVDWPTYGQIQRQRNCAVIAGASGIFYFNFDWAWDGTGHQGQEGLGETYIDNVVKAAVQSPMDYGGSQRCIP